MNVCFIQASAADLRTAIADEYLRLNTPYKELIHFITLDMLGYSFEKLKYFLKRHLGVRICCFWMIFGKTKHYPGGHNVAYLREVIY